MGTRRRARRGGVRTGCAHGRAAADAPASGAGREHAGAGRARGGAARAAALGSRAYRSEFRADPAQACAEEGLPEVAAQLGRGRALETLEIRESRSSLAGVLMAAALEGASLAVLVDHAQAAGTVDPDAAKALAQLTQNGQPAVPAPPAPVDPTTPGRRRTGRDRRDHDGAAARGRRDAAAAPPVETAPPRRRRPWSTHRAPVQPPRRPST